MALTTPNQILHYTASAANYPGWAIRVGNFAVSDVGNNVKGSWGTFRLGLNPKAFTTAITPAHLNVPGFSIGPPHYLLDRGFVGGEELQTYAVYIYKPDGFQLCAGPACHLIDTVKIVPNSDEPYPGGIGPGSLNPWYHLIKFTQFMGASTSLVGTYSSTLAYDTTSFGEAMKFLENTFRWYREQLELGDGALYAGGTAGNRVLINKFYPPIITTSATRMFDTSYLPSFPYTSAYGVQIPPGRKVYNLVGLTHGVIRSGENFKLWDFEGGCAGAIGGGGLLDIPGDPGFRLCGSDEPSNWCLNMYVMSPTASGSYDEANFIKQGISNTNLATDVTFSMGVRERSSGNFQLYMNLWLPTGRNDYVLHGATMSLYRWYFISVKRIKNNNYTFYFNGKEVHLQNESTTQGSFTGANAGATAAVGIWPHGGAAIRFQYLSYYPINQSSDDIRENFLRYALNSKIKNSNIRIALDTGTKTSHQGYEQWIDISGYDYHATSPSGDNFAWDGYKPGYTTRRGDILRSGRTDLDYFASSPFCLSIWFYIVDQNQSINIFNKGLNTYFTITHVNGGTIQVSTEQNGTGQYSRTSTVIDEGKWHNIFVTGTSLEDVKFYIFTHTGETEVVQSWTLEETTAGMTNPLESNTSDIRFGDTNDYCRIASIVYWNTNFSEALCREFFSIQKGRFGMDSYSNRIADGNEFGCLHI